MKKFYLVAISLFLNVICCAQQGVPEPSKGVEQFVITKNDGTEYIGEILSDDGREVLINTSKLGKFIFQKPISGAW